MRTSDVRAFARRTVDDLRVLALVAVPLVFALVKCAPQTNCVRISDCDDGMTCRAGRCVFDQASSDPIDAGADAATATVADASVATDAPSGDAASDAADDGSDAEAGPDASAD